MIIDGDAQPGPRDLTVIAPGPEIELGVIGLPELVRPRGFTTMDEIVGLAVAFLALPGERLRGHRCRNGRRPADGGVHPGAAQWTLDQAVKNAGRLRRT